MNWAYVILVWLDFPTADQRGHRCTIFLPALLTPGPPGLRTGLGKGKTASVGKAVEKLEFLYVANENVK